MVAADVQLPERILDDPRRLEDDLVQRCVLSLRQLLDGLLGEVVHAAADRREDVVPRPIEALGHDDDVLGLLRLERERDGGLFACADHGVGGRDLQPLLPCDQRVGARSDRWGDEVTRRIALGSCDARGRRVSRRESVLRLRVAPKHP